MTDPGPRPARGAAPATMKRRMSKRNIRIIAWAAGLLGFALPWTVFQAVPRPGIATPQVVVVPAGSRVVVTKGAPGKASVVVVSTKGGTTTPPVTATGGSHPPP